MRQEFRKEIKLYPTDNKKLIPIPIEIPRGTETLRIRFSWAPKDVDDLELGRKLMRAKVESYSAACDGDPNIPEAVKGFWLNLAQDVDRFLPLRNLLNFSLYDPQGRFRGRWDSPQYFDKWMEIGKNTSRGFLPGGVAAGEWTLELELHALLSQEVTAVLDVEILGQAAPQWYAGEMHSHTNHSDGKASLAELMAAASQRGLDFIVLSDHNTIAAHPDIPKANSAPLVIPGQEWTTFYGHAVAVGIREYIDWRAERTDPLHEKISAVHNQGGLVSIAHPFVVGDPFCTGCEWEYANVDLDAVDLVEIWSGSWQKGAIPNWRALSWWDKLLNRGYRITGVGARDVHRLEQFDEPDTPNTYVYAPVCSKEEILAALKQGAVQVSRGPIAEFAVETSTGRTYSLGQTVPRDELDGARISLSIPALERDDVELRLIADGKAAQRQPDYKGEQQHFAIPQGVRWVRVQIHHSTPDEAPILITNPIYFG